MRKQNEFWFVAFLLIFIGAMLVFGVKGFAQPYPTLPSNVCDTLKAQRALYPAIPTADQLGEMLNNTALVHKAEGFGLSRKTGGTRCPSPAGQIACDILMRKSDSLIWDVLIAAGEASTPTCGEALGPMTDPSRPFVDPVGTTPPPPPNGVTNEQLLAEIMNLFRGLGIIQQEQAQQHRELHDELAQINQKLDRIVEQLNAPIPFPNYAGKVKIPFLKDTTIILVPVR